MVNIRILFLSASLALTHAIHAASPRFPITDGEIHAIATQGDTVYIGGRFNLVGEYTGSIVVFDANTGARDRRFPVVNGPVYSAIADGQGGFYIGGRFTQVGELRRNCLARVRADGTVDPDFDVNVTPEPLSSYFMVSATGNQLTFSDWIASSVRCLSLDGSTLYVGGAFKEINGSLRRYSLAAVDARTGKATDFDTAVEYYRNPPVGEDDVAGQVMGLLPYNDTLYLSGQFNVLNRTNPVPGKAPAGYQIRQALAAVDKRTGKLTPWNPNAPLAISDNVNTSVLIARSMLIYADTLILGGIPKSSSGDNLVGNTKRSGGLAKIDLMTGEVASWDPMPTVQYGKVGSILRRNRTLFYTRWSYFSDWEKTTSADLVNGVEELWQPELSNNSNHSQLNGLGVTLAAFGDSIFIAGNFIQAKGETDWVSRLGLGRFDSETGYVKAWQPDIAYSPLPKKRFNPIDGAANPLALCVSDGKLLVGGEFMAWNVQPCLNLAAFDTRSGALRTWNAAVVKPLPTSMSCCYPADQAVVRSLAVQGTNVYVGGDFVMANSATVSFSQGYAGLFYDTVTDVGTVPTDWPARTNFAAFHADTGDLLPWAPTANAPVYSVITLGNRVFAGGDFSRVNGTARRSFLTAFDAASGELLPWAPEPDDLVRVLATDGKAVYAGGNFKTIKETAARPGIAALDPVTGDALAFNPRVAVSSIKPVLALAVRDGVLYAGGEFSGNNSVNGNTRRDYAAAFDLATGQATAWDPAPDKPVRSLMVLNGSVALGGDFARVQTQALQPVSRRFVALVDRSEGKPVAFDDGASYTAFEAGVNTLGTAGGLLWGGAYYTDWTSGRRPVNSAEGTGFVYYQDGPFGSFVNGGTRSIGHPPTYAEYSGLATFALPAGSVVEFETSPTVVLTAPAIGANFTAPASITLQASASDPDGIVVKVEFFSGPTRLGEDATAPFSLGWNEVAAGSYTLTARATDANGATATSTPVSILVSAATNQPSPATGPAVSEMAATYTPGITLAISLQIKPPTATIAYAVEDRPPTGWTISSITEGGVFDPATGVMKWGVYFDDQARTLKYSATPPPGATGPATFRGVASFDGVEVLITGTRQVISGTSTVPPTLGPRFLVDCLTPDSSTLSLCFEAIPGRLYELEKSENLQTWNRTSLNVRAANATATIRYPKDTARQQFFRVRLTD